MEELIPKKCNGQSGSDGNKYVRTRRIEVWVNPEEHQRIASRAAKQGFRHNAQYLRQAGIYGGDVESPMAVKKALLAAQYEINRIGNNINQISRALNAGNDPDDEMKLMLMQILEIAQQMVSDAAKPRGTS